MTVAGPAVLAFPDRKQDGRFPVKDRDGTPVAHISVKWTGSTFTASDADDQPLCEASAAWGGLANTWTATGPLESRCSR